MWGVCAPKASGARAPRSCGCVRGRECRLWPPTAQAAVDPGGSAPNNRSRRVPCGGDGRGALSVRFTRASSRSRGEDRRRSRCASACATDTQLTMHVMPSTNTTAAEVGPVANGASTANRQHPRRKPAALGCEPPTVRRGFASRARTRKSVGRLLPLRRAIPGLLFEAVMTEGRERDHSLSCRSRPGEVGLHRVAARNRARP